MSGGTVNLTLRNVGEAVSHLRSGEALTDITVRGRTDDLYPGDELKLHWPASKPYPVSLVFSYYDSASRRRRSEFEYTEKGQLVEQAETDPDGQPHFE